MKKAAKIFGIIALAAVIGLAFAGCDLFGDDTLEGTYTGTVTQDGVPVKYTFDFTSDGKVTMTESATVLSVTVTDGPYNGTYTVSGGTVAILLTVKGEQQSMNGTLSDKNKTITFDEGDITLVVKKQ